MFLRLLEAKIRSIRYPNSKESMPFSWTSKISLLWNMRLRNMRVSFQLVFGFVVSDNLLSRHRHPHSWSHFPRHVVKPAQWSWRPPPSYRQQHIPDSCKFLLHTSEVFLTPQQSSVASMFTEEGGWPFGKVKDSDPVIDRQRELGLDNPVRKVGPKTYT